MTVLSYDLPEIDPEMEFLGGVSACRHVSFDDFLSLFDKKVHDKIREVAKQDGVTHVVCFENLDMWARHLGKRTAMIVGTKQSMTLKAVLQTPGFRLGPAPSRFEFPVAYARIAAVESPSDTSQQP